ncbi:endonuclease V [Parasediminibacterium sp. JCM 36343]|uniref:endonuclease V n=1 Tax=Parasediminibacterium sp. JCM 36343 TaxID=3374279 RepID=UPI00397E0451
MLLALDIYYRDDTAKAVGVLFNWEDEQPASIIVEWIENVEPYVSGKFYKRELPCIMKIMENVELSQLEAIIIDGYVFIDNDKNYGLGGHLWEALGKTIPIIGVAKTSFFSNKGTVLPITRGESKNPLFVSAIGMDVSEAANLVRNMKGSFRIPTVLKELDRVTKEV